MQLMWKQLIQGHIDYCSQLYQPLQSGSLQRLENLQKVYTKKIPEVRMLNYWERLEHLKIISQQRRLERYRIIYTWKVLEGLAPNGGINTSGDISDRMGRKCVMPTLKGRQKVKTLREQSFQSHGPRLFNALPKHIKSIYRCGVEEFKEKLDQFLTTIPEQQQIGGLVPATCNQMTGQPSNSPVDQIREHLRGQGTRIHDEQ